MATAAHASARLVRALEQLHGEVHSAPHGAARARRYLEKREAAVEALVRHAQFIVSQFAFLDGERIAGADARLLDAFYADPLECVATRYCWALLTIGEGTASLPGITSATRAEYEAFVKMQTDEQVAERPQPEPTVLHEAERAYHRRADRTGYILTVLRRLLLIQRHVAGTGAQGTRLLETEVVNALEISEETATTLRDIRRARIPGRSGGHGQDG